MQGAQNDDTFRHDSITSPQSITESEKAIYQPTKPKKALVESPSGNVLNVLELHSDPYRPLTINERQKMIGQRVRESVGSEEGKEGKQVEGESVNEKGAGKKGQVEGVEKKKKRGCCSCFGRAD